VPIVEDYAWCLELWRGAATEEILLPGMSRSEALSLRSRMYRIRAAMKQQRHTYFPDVAHTKISVIQLDTGVGGRAVGARDRAERCARGRAPVEGNRGVARRYSRYAASTSCGDRRFWR
jgi:hypothetical protein